MSQNPKPFLPANYSPPKGGGAYMTFQPGSNRFRVLGQAALGWKLWIGAKPYRNRMEEPFSREELENADANKDGSTQTPKHFWAFPVIDMADGLAKVLEITQKGVQTDIEALYRDKDWGDPSNYDIEVTKTGKGLETGYTTKPKPASKLTADQQAAWDAVRPSLNLDAIYDGGSPFGGSEVTVEDLDAVFPLGKE